MRGFIVLLLSTAFLQHFLLNFQLLLTLISPSSSQLSSSRYSSSLHAAASPSTHADRNLLHFYSACIQRARMLYAACVEARRRVSDRFGPHGARTACTAVVTRMLALCAKGIAESSPHSALDS